jgi:2-desacetyl-2-hydroxyethyl bacteriochlorophyllide A dehydrogenase
MKGKRGIITEPYKTEIEEYEIVDPTAGQVLVETEASGISPGTELAIYTGIHQWLNDPTNKWAKFPFRGGYSAVGRVLKVGPEVTRFKEGDRVIWPGRHESHAVVQAEGDMADIWPIADHVPAASAALLSLGRFPFTALARSSTILGQSVAILGLGLIGQIATRLFNAAGAYPIIGVDAVEQRRAWARGTYGVRTLNPTEGDAVENIKELLGGKRADIVVDATGVPAALQDALRLVTDGGQVILVGSPRGTIQNFDSYWDLHGRSVSIVGAHGSAVGIHARDKFPFTRSRQLPLLVHFLESGKLKLDDLITHHVPGDQIGEMYDGLLNKRNDYLGVALHWDV